jgi:hypothetical protein
MRRAALIVTKSKEQLTPPPSFTRAHCFNLAASLRVDAERLRNLKVKPDSKLAEQQAMWVSALENAAAPYELFAK